jgi:hypothetical protein
LSNPSEAARAAWIKPGTAVTVVWLSSKPIQPPHLHISWFTTSPTESPVPPKDIYWRVPLLIQINMVLILINAAHRFILYMYFSISLSFISYDLLRKPIYFFFSISGQPGRSAYIPQVNRNSSELRKQSNKIAQHISWLGPLLKILLRQWTCCNL